MIVGIAASSGYGEGKALIYKQQELIIDQTPIDDSKVESEIQRFHEAKDKAREQIQQLKSRAMELLTKEESEVFDAHLMLLDDPTLSQKVINSIKKKLIKAELALDMAEKDLFNLFQNMDNDIMKERAVDIRDVCTRVLYLIKGLAMVTLTDLEENTIIVAENLTPSDTMQMDVSKVTGIVTDVGGKSSHVAIMARSLEIPAVVGTKVATQTITEGQPLWVNGNLGNVLVDPTKQEMERFEQEKKVHEQYRQELKKYSSMASETQDGRKVECCANIGGFADASSSVKYGPDGVGLFRTEFLFMSRSTCPTEEEQFAEYKKVAELMKERATIIRTLDIGGDKELDYIDFGEEENPFLGWRAMRMCLDKTDLLKTQFRAILRAGVFGKLRIMYPMIINPSEVIKANEILEQAKKELLQEGIAFDHEIEVGIMVETPAAAVTADILINYVDFFSIGTNDLTQYTLAVDRGNERISSLYAPHHPSVLRLIKMVVDASHRAGKWTGMCGEMAGMEEFTELLVGLGLDELSMAAGSILQVRKNLVNLNADEARMIADKILQLETADKVLEFVKE